MVTTLTRHIVLDHQHHVHQLVDQRGVVGKVEQMVAQESGFRYVVSRIGGSLVRTG